MYFFWWSHKLGWGTPRLNRQRCTHSLVWVIGCRWREVGEEGRGGQHTCIQGMLIASLLHLCRSGTPLRWAPAFSTLTRPALTWERWSEHLFPCSVFPACVINRPPAMRRPDNSGQWGHPVYLPHMYSGEVCGGIGRPLKCTFPTLPPKTTYTC